MTERVCPLGNLLGLHEDQVGRYVCREQNARHARDRRLVELRIVYMGVKTLPDYGRTPPEKVMLREQRCS